MAPKSRKYLYGGGKSWSASNWVSSDDYVIRGGGSESHLSPSSNSMIFSGYLDTATLGNAGFAEQRTSGDISLDLSDYDGLELDIEKSDGLAYTLTLRDELPSKGADGKEQSSVSWDFDFRPQEGGEVLFMRWKDLKPNYKGKEKKDAKPVKRSKIKRIGIKIRSFYGEQEGDFELVVRSIAAYKK